MKRHWIKKVLFISLFVFFVIGCSAGNNEDEGEVDNDQAKNGEIASGGEIQFAYSAQPSTIDPHITTAVATSDIVRGIYETLVTVDSEHNFQPMLAESYEISEDGTSITFILREDVHFHNGKEMTAEDVLASMNRWQEKSPMGQAQFSDATFEAEDDYTVVVTFPEPLSTALSVLSANMGAFPAIMPKETIEGATETGVEEYIGTGPFAFEDWKQDVHIHLTKYDDYNSREEESDGLAGKKEALVDDIYFNFVNDPSTRVAGMLSGEYDIAHGIPHDNVEQIEASGTIENNIVPGSTLILTFNKKKGIFTDLKFREAVLQALNTEEMLHAAFSDEKFYTPNHNLVMPHLEGQFYSEVGKDRYNMNDPEKAKQILEDTGYAGEEIVLLTTRDYEEFYNTSVVAQGQLEAIGLNVKLEVADWPTFLEKKENENEFDINITGFGPQPEPTSYLFVMSGPHSGWTEDEEFHNLVKEFRSKPTLEDTKEVYDEIMQWNADNIPFIKIGDFSRNMPSQDTIDNFRYVDGPLLWNVSQTK